MDIRRIDDVQDRAKEGEFAPRAELSRNESLLSSWRNYRYLFVVAGLVPIFYCIYYLA
jgi:hypothetical protein